MNYKEAKEEFIQSWGRLGASWGINKTMAQIHALLLISPDPMSVEDILDDLKISRGNASMNLRALIDWGIVRKSYIAGDRKEYFSSEKDIWMLATRVASERKKRELTPVIQTLEKLIAIEKSDQSRKAEEFRTVTGDLLKFAHQSEKILDRFTTGTGQWFYKSLGKLIGR